MNIFFLDKNPKLVAQYHVDRHVIKMNLENAQLISTAYRSLTGNDKGYKSTHANHPCGKWVRNSYENYRWMLELGHYLNEEYRYRYDRDYDHASWKIVTELPIIPCDLFPVVGFTIPALAMLMSAK